MRIVGLKVLKSRLSEYVRLAAAGERVLVTNRGHVVAELVPPQAGAADVAADGVVAETLRSGSHRPHLVPERGTPPRSPIAPLAELLGEMERDREER